MIAPIIVARILIMTILAATAIAQESSNAGNGEESNSTGNASADFLNSILSRPAGLQHATGS
jgi:hypothetical protein